MATLYLVMFYFYRLLPERTLKTWRTVKMKVWLLIIEFLFTFSSQFIWILPFESKSVSRMSENVEQQLKHLMRRAWRERWSDLLWGVYVKEVLNSKVILDYIFSFMILYWLKKKGYTFGDLGRCLQFDRLHFEASLDWTFPQLAFAVLFAAFPQCAGT